MPSVSKKQFEFMLAAANDPEFAKNNDIKQETAKEWVYSDYEKVIVDPEHGALIGVSEEDAFRYIDKHTKPGQESAIQPLSLKW